MTMKYSFLFVLIFCFFLFPLYSESGKSTVTILGVEMEWDGYRVKESESDMDPYETSFDDIGENRFFTREYPVERETYTINENELGETEVVHISSPTSGPVIYVVAGVHGDEKAAWYAGVMLENAKIKCGDLYILSPANKPGAANRRRYFYSSQDLNRSFPGSMDGNQAEKMAASIFQDIKRVDPDFVFDLHEAIVYTEGRDFLGSTYIFSDLDLMADLFFDLLWATEDGVVCHNAFSYTGPGPAGSINRTVTEELGIPVITVETFRGFDIKRRVYDQLDTVQFVLEYYGMV